MNQPRILIADDEPSIRFVLERTLRDEGYILDTASHGEEAIRMLAKAPYDLLLLDLRMEPVGGLQVLTAVREHDPNIVVIILTAHGSLESAIEALRLGAFDYLLKPTSPDVIRKRVREGLSQRRQLMRRHHILDQIENLRQALDTLDTERQGVPPPATGQRFVRSGKLVIDCYHRLATLDGKLLDLTTAEFDLLLCLAKASPEPLAPRSLVNCALGYDCEDMEAREIAKWHIHHLRRKIEPEPETPRYIKTVRHKGYLWRGE